MGLFGVRVHGVDKYDCHDCNNLLFVWFQLQTKHYTIRQKSIQLYRINRIVQIIEINWESLIGE